MSHERSRSSQWSHPFWGAVLFVACGLSLAGCTPGGLSWSDQTAVAMANTATASARVQTPITIGRANGSGTPTVGNTPVSGSSTPTAPPTVASTPASTTVAGQNATQPPSTATPTTGIATPTVASAVRKYTDPERHFSFVIPDGWQRQQTQVADVVVQFVSDRLRGDVNIVTEDAPDVTLDQYVTGTLAAIKRTYPDLTLDTKGVQPILLGGKSAQRYDFSGMARQTPIHMTQLVVINNGMAYVITFTVAAQDAAAFTEAMDRISRTFDFLPADS